MAKKANNRPHVYTDAQEEFLMGSSLPRTELAAAFKKKFGVTVSPKALSTKRRKLPAKMAKVNQMVDDGNVIAKFYDDMYKRGFVVSVEINRIPGYKG